MRRSITGSTFTYTEFVDRDGKYQLTMLSHSAFAPLAESVTAMLKEEFFHMFTGHTGLTRILRAGKMPIPIVQKYFNKWLSTAYDLFGTDHSSSANWSYVWGLKGRFDEHEAKIPADKNKLNDLARDHYLAECAKLIDQLNQLVPEGQPKLYAPHLNFNRSIGEHVGKTYSVTGELLSPEAYKKHLPEVLPTPDDEKILNEIISAKRLGYADTNELAEERFVKTLCLVCQNVDCKNRGSEQLMAELQKRVEAKGLADVEVKSYMCFGACQEGPNIVLYPEKTGTQG